MKIEELILQKRQKENRDWHHPQVGRYHASSVYSIVNGDYKPEDFFKPQLLDDRTIFTFEIGKMYHTHAQSLFPKESVEKKVEIDCGDFKIVGKVDLMLKVPCELKTCSRIPPRPKIEHIYQMQAYLKGTNSDKGIITYIEKHPTIYRTANYEVLFNEETWNTILSKVGVFHKELLKLKH